MCRPGLVVCDFVALNDQNCSQQFFRRRCRGSCDNCAFTFTVGGVLPVQNKLITKHGKAGLSGISVNEPVLKRHIFPLSMSLLRDVQSFVLLCLFTPAA